jgi:hypothetical protein
MTTLTSPFMRLAARVLRPTAIMFARGVIVTLTACASAHRPTLTAGAAHVEEITAEQGLSCTYLRSVEYVTKVGGMGKSYEIVHQVGKDGLRDVVASIGGNAYINTRMDADPTWGHVHYAGQAFQCSTKVFASFGFAGRPWH